MRYESFKSSLEDLSDLKLDLANPRIGHKNDQSECIEAILNSKNFINLVEDIAINGLGISPIVVYQDDENRLTVMDGNRRTTALKLLSNPSLAKQHSLAAKIDVLAKKTSDNGDIFETVSVFKSNDLDAIYDHMKLTHTGENEGIGQKSWTAMAQAMFAIDRKISDDNLLAAQLVVFAQKNHGFIFNDEYPITVLTRLINKDRLMKIGITFDDGKIAWTNKSDGRVKMLDTILSEIRDQEIKTKDVFDPSQQETYLKKLFELYNLLPSTLPRSFRAKDDKASLSSENENKLTQTTFPQEKLDDDSTPSSAKILSKSSSPTKPTWDRKTVVNAVRHRFNFDGHSDKLNNIYVELKKIQLDGSKGTPIAATFLIRAFTEMAVEEYRSKNSSGGGGLAVKCTKAAEHMHQRNKIDAELEKRITHLANDDQFLSFTSLQKYLHSKNFHPSKQSINTLWDELYPFLKVCLEG
ncbi:ParB N-terminal domain-containing protein [Sulfurimonas sp. HSL-3221]|uniref:ParB/Srx family N-terminal domain-containing protein n=1 Tax=Thiomicrolovo sulfuroxydans TaxID=2894755 RepID=UPI001E4CE058|nr:ParB/Srx family N-terminal domain-containing protein [Sulfurimonas sp. HSL-3221]UFS61562.1 ParB N-terminal domain-containing protein [Sulfurimonas sp. HSL-3221]